MNALGGLALDLVCLFYGVSRVQFETDESLRSRTLWSMKYSHYDSGAGPQPKLYWYGYVWIWLTERYNSYRR